MSETMKRLSALAKEQLKAEAAVAKAERALEKAKSDLQVIAEQVIPQVMEELQLETFTTRSGLKIVVPEVVRANISEANRVKAYAWLVKHGHGKLIRDQFEVVAKDEKQAERLRKVLAKFTAREKPTIHSQTLNAFVREALREGIVLPASISIFRQRVSKIVVNS
jgi:hypothetical protein